MQINKKQFLQFLQSIALQGEVSISEVNLTFTEKSISAIAVIDGGAVALHGTITGNFENIGTVGVADLKSFINFVKNFNEETINLIRKDNKLILDNLKAKEKLKISVILKAPEYVASKLDLGKFDTKFASAQGNETVLKLAHVDKILDCVTSMKSKSLKLTGKDTELMVELDDDNENSIMASFSIDKLKEDFSIHFARIILDVMKTIKNDMVVSFKNNSPLAISTNYILEGNTEATNNKVVMHYLVAPLKK